MSTTLNFGLNLGSSLTGLTDLRAQIMDSDLANVGSAVSAGFTEIGGGSYAWSHSFDDSFSGYVKFYRQAAPSAIYFTLAVSTANDTEIAPSDTPSTVNAYLYTKTVAGVPVSGKVVSYRLVSPPEGGAGSFPDDTYTVTSDDDGLAQIEMIREAYYQYWIGNGRPKTVHITDETADPYELPQVTE